MKNNRVAITGGAGFIGSNLAYELTKTIIMILSRDVVCRYMKNRELAIY